MKTLRIHGPVYLLLLLVVFTAYGRNMAVPLWDGTDARILCDAHELSRDPVSMFGHIGFYFSQPVLQLLTCCLFPPLVSYTKICQVPGELDM